MTGKDRAEGGEYVETTSTQAVLTVMRDTDAPIVTVGDVAKAVDASRETARRKLTDPYERVGSNAERSALAPSCGGSPTRTKRRRTVVGTGMTTTAKTPTGPTTSRISAKARE